MQRENKASVYNTRLIASWNIFYIKKYKKINLKQIKKSIFFRYTAGQQKETDSKRQFGGHVLTCTGGDSFTKHGLLSCTKEMFPGFAIPLV
jgi:hypothetical protein